MTKDATNKAIQKDREQRFFMPTLGRVIMAETLKEATKLAEKIAEKEADKDIKSNNIK